MALLAWQNLSIIGIAACLVCVILGFNTWASIVYVVHFFCCATFAIFFILTKFCCIPFLLYLFFHYIALTLFFRRVLVVNIKLRDAPVDGQLDPIVSANRAPASGRIPSFRDSDDGAGLDALADEESAYIAPIRSGSNGARRMARGGHRAKTYDDGL